MTFLTIFLQMLALLIIIGAGVLGTKLGYFDDHTNSSMSKMIVSIFNPMLAVSNAIAAVGKIDRNNLVTVGLIAAGMFLFFIIAGMFLTPLFTKDPEQKKIFQLMFVFSNLGFIGIPVVNSILGAEYVIYVTEFTLVYNLIFYTYGIALMDGSFSVSALKSAVNPGTVFSFAALLIIIFEIHLPGFMVTAITYLGNIASPMALVAVGFTLVHANLKSVFGVPKLYLFSLVKLIVLPLILLPVLKLVAHEVSLLPVCMIMFGMPVGNLPLILGAQKGLDCTTCGAAIILSTLLCIVTVPFLLMFVI